MPRPSASVPVGLIMLMSLMTGRLSPRLYTTPTEPWNDFPKPRSYCALFWMLYASLRLGSGAKIVCAGRTAPTGRVVGVLGKAGAPTPVPFTAYLVRPGRALC